MITITEKKLQAAIQIALTEKKIHTDELEDTLIGYIKTLSTGIQITEIKKSFEIGCINLTDNLNNQYIYDKGQLYKKKMVEQWVEIK